MPRSITCLINGLYDQPLQDLNGLTPLEKAHTPHLDQLTQQGEWSPPQKGGFATALYAWLTKENPSHPLGLGPLEAHGAGFVLSPSQVAFCVRFASSGDGVVVDVSDQLCTDSEGQAFVKALNHSLGGKGLHFIHLQGPRAALITDHPELKAVLSSHLELNPIDTIGLPWKDFIPVEGQLRPALIQGIEQLQEAELNAMRLDLEEDPINALLMYSGGAALPRSHGYLWPGEVWTAEPITYSIIKSIGGEAKRFPPEKERFDLIKSMGEALQKDESDKDLLIEIPHLWLSTYRGDLLEKIKTLEWIDRQLIRLCLDLPTPFSLLCLKQCDIRYGSICEGSCPLLGSPHRASTTKKHASPDWTAASIVPPSSERVEVCSPAKNSC